MTTDLQDETTWEPSNPPETLLYCCDLLSYRAHSKWFWMAWYVQEHGWVDWQPANNPYNISGPIDNTLAWFRGASLTPNETVAYVDQAHGLMATILFLQACFPRVLWRLYTEEEACLSLDAPGEYGRWCPDPEYGNKILAIMHQLESVHG